MPAEPACRDAVPAEGPRCRPSRAPPEAGGRRRARGAGAGHGEAAEAVEGPHHDLRGAPAGERDGGARGGGGRSSGQGAEEEAGAGGRCAVPRWHGPGGAAGAMGAVCVPALRDAGVKHTPKDVPDWKLGKTHFAGWLGFVLCFFFFPVEHHLCFLSYFSLAFHWILNCGGTVVLIIRTSK